MHPEAAATSKTPLIFSKKIALVRDLPDDTILVTMAVKALFTNTPQKANLHAIRCSLSPDHTSTVTKSLTKFILEHN